MPACLPPGFPPRPSGINPLKCKPAYSLTLSFTDCVGHGFSLKVAKIAAFAWKRKHKPEQIWGKDAKETLIPYGPEMARAYCGMDA